MDKWTIASGNSEKQIQHFTSRITDVQLTFHDKSAQNIKHPFRKLKTFTEIPLFVQIIEFCICDSKSYLE